MQQYVDMFGPGSNMERRVITDYVVLAEKVKCLKDLGFRVGATSGSYDLMHEGHLRYLEKAKAACDVLVVGVDSDAKVRQRKHKEGVRRPIVEEAVRLEMLCHSRNVDLVFLKNVGDERWQFIKTVKPHVLTITEDAYGETEIVELENLGIKVNVLERQAATSTTATIRQMMMESLEPLRKWVAPLHDYITQVDQMKTKTGGQDEK